MTALTCFPLWHVVMKSSYAGHHYCVTMHEPAPTGIQAFFMRCFAPKCPKYIALPGLYQHVDWMLAYLHSIIIKCYSFLFSHSFVFCGHWLKACHCHRSALAHSSSFRGHMVLYVNANFCGICFCVSCYTKARFDIVSWWQHSVSFTEVSESRDEELGIIGI